MGLATKLAVGGSLCPPVFRASKQGLGLHSKTGSPWILQQLGTFWVYHNLALSMPQAVPSCQAQ
jgi:hypothetical protein